MTAQKLENIADSNHFPGFISGQNDSETLIEFRHQGQSAHGVPTKHIGSQYLR